MAKARLTLEEMAESIYDDPEIAAAVIEDVDKRHNREKIVAGDLTLPTAKDARHWYERITGKAGMTPTERSQAEIIKSQDARLTALEAQLRGRKE